ncbi:hypothetical protein EGH10_09615 [Brevibacillus laterosporus]|nr:hypothetical protein DM460_16460 [Brevibacillus laterosporus]TPH13024.1 hypothetical protein EGH10_09615 [Brevibacillus laterosporus]HAS02193.1 hypothetical protein [Brevibacillus sp.]
MIKNFSYAFFLSLCSSCYVDGRVFVLGGISDIVSSFLPSFLQI